MKMIIVIKWIHNIKLIDIDGNIWKGVKLIIRCESQNV